MFDLEIDSCIEWIRGGGFRSVAVQLPEGLKIRAPEISDKILNETGAETIILGDPCYGACDLFIDYKRYADALIHFGHAPIPPQENDPDVRFVEVRAKADISYAIEKISDMLPEKVGLLATIQYIGMLPETKAALESKGKKVSIGEGDGRAFYPGQVLGCNCTAATDVEDDVDAFLFLGEGDFHPLAASFGVSKPIIILNPLTGEARSVDDTRDRILRRRFAAIENARSAETFLIILCSKTGQHRPDDAREIFEKIRSSGRKAYTVLMNEIGPDALMHYRVDAYVNTACPRIAMDDSSRYSKPMLTVTEAEIALGLREWDDYIFDTIGFCGDRST